jgi:hypothetical protein
MIMSGTGRDGSRLALLTARINKLYCVEAGQPTYATLEKTAEAVIAEAQMDREYLRHLPRTTACDLIGGKYKRTPDWLMIRTLIVVCHRIAGKSNLPVPSLETLFEEFSHLWRAAKEEEKTETTGDVLAPEEPALHEPPAPESWGRLGKRWLRAAENGDARAAYEVAVLLACEAAGTSGDEAERWRKEAAFWRGRATGKVPEAATLLLDGQRLVDTACALAAEHKRAEREGSSRLFLRAAAQAKKGLTNVKPPDARRRARTLLRHGDPD